MAYGGNRYDTYQKVPSTPFLSNLVLNLRVSYLIGVNQQCFIDFSVAALIYTS